MIPVPCCAVRLYLACVAVCVECAWQHRWKCRHSAHVNIQNCIRLWRAGGCFRHVNSAADMLMCIFPNKFTEVSKNKSYPQYCILL